MQAPPPFPHAGELSALASSLCWAIGAILFTRIRESVSASALNLGKNLVGSGLFLVLLWGTQGVLWPTHLPWDSLAWLAASGIVGLALCDSLLFRAFREIGPRRVNVFMALSPALVALLAVLPPLREQPDALTVVGMGLCLSGIVLVVMEKRASGRRHRASRLAGIRDALFAAALQALGIVLTRYGVRSAEVTVTEGATIRLVFGALGVVGMGLATRRLGRMLTELAQPRVGRRVFLAAFIGTFLGIGTNQAGIDWSTHVGVAATLNALPPVWLVPLSRFFLGEHHDWRAWASALLAVGGIALMTAF